MSNHSVRRTFGIAVLLFALPLAATACDSSDDATTTAPSPSPSPDEGSPSPTGELPPITVDAPLPGDAVTSPVTVSGTANVFEATVTLRIVDDSGVELVRDFTTATCGTGCRGTYETRLRFDVDEEQSATLEVFEESAEDGSPLHVVAIPLTLLPD